MLRGSLLNKEEGKIKAWRKLLKDLNSTNHSISLARNSFNVEINQTTLMKRKLKKYDS